MFGWFKKSVLVPEPKKAVKIYDTLECLPTKIEVGRTMLKIAFDDETEFYTYIYGEPHQYVDNGQGYNSQGHATVSPVTVYKSIDKARHYISQLPMNRVSLVDDPNHVEKAMTGVIKRAEIFGTFLYEVDFNEYRVVKAK